MSYENIDKVPANAVLITRTQITKEADIKTFLYGKGFAFNHIINAEITEFNKKHREECYRKRIGVIPVTEPPDKKPPEAELFIAFYELPNSLKDLNFY